MHSVALMLDSHSADLRVGESELPTQVEYSELFPAHSAAADASMSSLQTVQSVACTLNGHSADQRVG